MNKKNKILLTSVGLAMLSGIAATGSTFAWFTTTRTASISYSSATVKSTQSNLTITYAGSANTVTASPNSGATNSLEITGGNNVTDISGDGVNFYKPVWSATPEVASAINEVTTAEGNWVEFKIIISRDNDNGMKVYLGEDTLISAVTANDDEDEQAVLASRLAVLDDSDQLKVLYAPDTNDTAHSYITENDGGPAAYGDSGFEIATNSTVVNTFTTESNIAAADATGTLIADLSTANSANVTFRAWLEGEDSDAINDAIGGVFNIDIDIYGLEA